MKCEAIREAVYIIPGMNILGIVLMGFRTCVCQSVMGPCLLGSQEGVCLALVSAAAARAEGSRIQ